LTQPGTRDTALCEFRGTTAREKKFWDNAGRKTFKEKRSIKSLPDVHWPRERRGTTESAKTHEIRRTTMNSEKRKLPCGTGRRGIEITGEKDRSHRIHF